MASKSILPSSGKDFNVFIALESLENNSLLRKKIGKCILNDYANGLTDVLQQNRIIYKHQKHDKM